MKRIEPIGASRNSPVSRRSQLNKSLRDPLGSWQSQPFKIFTFALLLLWLLPICICSASADCSIEYTPRSEKSAVFYIDVYSVRKVTAAVFELRFADDMAGYYSVVADDTATVRDHSEKGKVTFAFASDSAVSGKLCRVSFKALKEGSVDFTLHMVQAADADNKLLSDWSDHSLTVKLGKDDVEAAAKVSRTDKSSSGTAASASKHGGGTSDLSIGGDDAEDLSSGFFDLRRGDNVFKWILLGAGIPILIGGLVWLGILIGRRSKDQSDTTKEKPGEILPEPNDPPVTDTDQNDSE
jgi:hypothetical protein